ncbi:response regulator transcription factor [Dactylosporangium sp. CA-092794]|uniref:helix-turn-helix transcriptional regulator n=1 Tax=Dactylosporangium sp. CA-092794 TaxID=3239929 RepID=UPI003D8BE770
MKPQPVRPTGRDHELRVLAGRALYHVMSLSGVPSMDLVARIAKLTALAASPERGARLLLALAQQARSGGAFDVAEAAAERARALTADPALAGLLDLEHLLNQASPPAPAGRPDGAMVRLALAAVGRLGVAGPPLGPELARVTAEIAYGEGRFTDAAEIARSAAEATESDETRGELTLLIGRCQRAAGGATARSTFRGVVAFAEARGLAVLTAKALDELSALDPLGAARLLAAPAPDAAPAAAPPAGGAHKRRSLGITDREWQVALLVATGAANKQIAERLRISARTVEKHVERLFHRTGSANRTALAATLLEWG